MFFKRLCYYLDPRTLFRHNEGLEGRNLNLKMMHGINRVSIFLFLVCIVVMAVRACG